MPTKPKTAKKPQLKNSEPPKKWYKETSTGRTVLASSYAEAIQLLQENQE